MPKCIQFTDHLYESILKVGIRKFREHLPQYLMTSSPVVTRHGETIGFYIPI
ncbi:MAG: hypothetical protein JO131_04440 [Gammaproteobacteria bacterium]|nr:hypothetical protein [Gammaproteobacteria bacterium]